jgi:hypothetical protein
MFNQINHLNKELAELVDRHTDRDGPQYNVPIKPDKLF